MIPLQLTNAGILGYDSGIKREYSNSIPKLKSSDCHTSYAKDRRNSKKVKNRKRQKK